MNQPRWNFFVIAVSLRFAAQSIKQLRGVPSDSPL